MAHTLKSGLIAVSALLLLPAVGSAARTRSSSEAWPNRKEQGLYQARLASTGQVLWTVEWETTVQKTPGGAEVEILERGQGQPPRYKEPIVWEKRMRVRVPEPGQASAFLPQSVVGSRWTQRGQLLSRMDVQMDPAGRSIVYQDSEDGGSGRSVRIPWSEQALPDELLFHWARMLPFEEASSGGAKKECLLLVSPTRRFRMRASVGGKEKVTTPAGTFSCYRVDLIPRLAGPLKALAPRISLWCRADPPHHWVRYEGPVGGPGSPRAILELVRLEQER